MFCVKQWILVCNQQMAIAGSNEHLLLVATLGSGCHVRYSFHCLQLHILAIILSAKNAAKETKKPVLETI